jgi:hypothetical protein
MVSITTNATALAAVLGDTYGKQIPFATALALTDVAFKVQRTEKTEMAKSLQLRNKFSQSGVQVNKAEKSDWPHTYAEVGIEERRSYLIDHITGGKRQGGSHGRAILEQDNLRSKSGRVPNAKRPAAMVARAMRAKQQAELAKTFGGRTGKDKRLPFLFDSRKWGNEVLAQRTGDERYPLRIIYAFRKGVSIKREFEMDTIAQQEVGATYYQAFNKALRRAIGSGKDKGERMGSRSRDQRIDGGR